MNHSQRDNMTQHHNIDITEGIDLENPSAELFSDIAHKKVEYLRDPKKRKNSSTQLRKFYDEVCLWHEKVGGDEQKFKELLPFIKMINAKVAYAQGRDNVTPEFTQLIKHCLTESTNVKSFNNFKLFFEAIIGFSKLYSK
jgi:CRISPR-associated protein Csm2